MTESETPSKEVMAKLAQATYQMGDKDLGRKQRLENTQNLISDTDWVVEPQHTNSEIATYRKRDDPSNIVIAHRGTKVDGKRGKTDLEADIMFALGLGGHVPTFKRRKTRTNKIIKALEPTQLHMTSHSLGGATQNYTIAKSNIVKKNLTSARTFNAAANPIFDNDIKVGKKTKKELDDKVVHHRIKHDPVSLGFVKNLPFGKLETDSVKHDPVKGKTSLDYLIRLNPELKKLKSVTERGLHAHAISNFHDGSIKKKN
jgi:hypothetical protein